MKFFCVTEICGLDQLLFRTSHIYGLFFQTSPGLVIWMTVPRSSLLSGYSLVSKMFSAIVAAVTVLPASRCLTTSKQLVWKGAVVFLMVQGPKKKIIICASRGQESQKKGKTTECKHANYSIKCLASSFALKQVPIIQVSLLTGKQNFSSCRSYSGQIFKNSINICISCSTVPLGMCRSWSETFDNCLAITYMKYFTFFFSCGYMKLPSLDLTLSTLQAMQ